MPAHPYYGSYCLYQTTDKRAAAALLGADNLVGDRLQVQMKRDGVDDVAWIGGRFGDAFCYLSASETQQIQLCQAKGWEVRAYLASVYFTDRPEPGRYWGEAVVLAFPPDDVALQAFGDTVGKMLADGVRPEVDLSEGELESIEESSGSWKPTRRRAKADTESGTALVKDHRTFTESMVEKARQRNMGCMVGGWAFLLALVALAVWALKSCGAF